MPGKEILVPNRLPERNPINPVVQDLTPEEFCEIFPGLAGEDVARLKEKRLEMNPRDERPLRSFVTNVLALPDVYRPMFVNRAMSGIIPPDTEVIININPTESTNGKH